MHLTEAEVGLGLGYPALVTVASPLASAIPQGCQSPLTPPSQGPGPLPSLGLAATWWEAGTMEISKGALLWMNDEVGTGKPQKEGQALS